MREGGFEQQTKRMQRLADNVPGARRRQRQRRQRRRRLVVAAADENDAGANALQPAERNFGFVFCEMLCTRQTSTYSASAARKPSRTIVPGVPATSPATCRNLSASRHARCIALLSASGQLLPLLANILVLESSAGCRDSVSCYMVPRACAGQLLRCCPQEPGCPLVLVFGRMPQGSFPKYSRCKPSSVPH